VLPEDDADRQLANGFLLEPSLSARSIQVLPEAGGCRKVLEAFNSEHVRGMEKFRNRYMILLIDFDGHPDRRLADLKAEIPEGLTNRVFIVGALTRPEELTAGLGNYETIGKAAARDCHEGTDTTWGHALLKHNAAEVERLRQHVRPILFP
jgi:hypothetical protein